MAEKFIELLNLDKELKEVLSIFQVKTKKKKQEIYYQVYFESKKNLNAEELLQIMRKVTKLKEVKIDNLDVFIVQPSEATNDYEVYSVLRFILDSFLNINHSHYFVEINSDEVTIKTSKKDVKNKLDSIYKKIILMLNNLGVWTGKVRIVFDKNSLDYSYFRKRKKDNIKEQNKNDRSNPTVIDGYKIVNPLTVKEDHSKSYFEGNVFYSEVRKTRNGQFIVNFKLEKDYKAISVIKFGRKELEIEKFKVKKGEYIRVYGSLKYSSYSKEYQLNAEIIQKLDESLDKKSFVEDVSGKRAELHIHTKMSAMDGVGSVKKYVKKAKEMGLTAIAITDHNSSQSFPEANYINDMKIIYGVEFDVVNDIDSKIVFNERDIKIKDAEYVFFDLETTGISPLNNEIIEFGGIKVKNGQVIDRLQLFIKPTKVISENTTKLTSITNEDVSNAPAIQEAIPQIISFIDNSVLVAHNAEFDYTFLNAHIRRHGYSEIKNTTIDTMKVSWILNPNNRSHRLGSVARIEGVGYDEAIAHRADYDAQVLYQVYENMLLRLLDMGIRNVLDLNKKISELYDYIFADHITVLAKNQEGLKTLYKIISAANTKFFNKRKKSPQILLSEILKRRDNLLIGSSCSNGILFKAASREEKELDRIIKYFDYVEIFPTDVYGAEIAKGFYSREGIQNVLKFIYKVAKRNKILPVATGNSHYVDQKDKISRDVYISAKGLGGKLHPLYDRKNPAYVKPNQHLRSTSSMLGSMERIFKSAVIAEELTIRNSNIIADMIEEMKPLKNGLYTPKIPGARKEFLRLIRKNTKRLYGDNPPEWIKKRIYREVESITRYGYDIVYYLSSLAVRKSLSDGYLVGSRGSVGSSIVATLTDITEVNPLEPHYVCIKCKHVEIVKNIGSGYDLPYKSCPICNKIMRGEGQDIPFETFLGFEGDKVPDIDLNFSGDYQSHIHNFIKEKLGEENVFRAGTISTVATKTAYGYVKGYFETIGEELPSNTIIEYISSIVEGTKRTTGQHPGGLIVVPDEFDIEDFSPINYPGNDVEASWLTTHFDFHSIHDNLLKLDLLGHVDPSAIRMLEDITGVDSRVDINMNDSEVLSLFTSNESLKIKKNLIDEKLGIIGIPEFGTGFVRELVRSAKPKTFSDLVRVSGLSHGTDVWIGNAKEIIDQGIGELKDVISVRDDIMTYLIRHGVTAKVAFDFMEAVRKGNLSNQPKKMEWEKELRENNVPEWYIESCNKIKYMFPKAHATAYVMMAFRIAWFKINHPLAYYATFFTKRDTEWDVEILYKKPSEMIKYREEVRKKGWEATDKEKSISSTLLIVLEMFSRGFSIENISIEKSHATEWIVNSTNNSLIPPFNILEGMGDAVAKKLIDARAEKLFEDLNDFKVRSGVSKTLQAKLLDLGILGDLKTAEDKVIDIFSMFE